MSSDTKRMMDAQRIAEIRSKFAQARQLLKINRTQSHQKVMFEMMSAVETAAKLLNEAWHLSTEYHLVDDEVRQEMVGIFEYLGKIKRDIKKEVKYKN